MAENLNQESNQQVSGQQSQSSPPDNSTSANTATPDESKGDKDRPLIIDVGAEYISGGSSVSAAGRDIYQIQINLDSRLQDVKLLKNLPERVSKIIAEMGEITYQVPDPLPADASVQDKVNLWFQGGLNNDQQRFFAVTLGLFNGLKYADFKHVYEIVLDVLKIKGNEEKKSKSYFDTSDVDLVDKVNAEIVRESGGLEEIIKYKDAQYESAVLQCLRDRYRNVLLDLLPALKKIGEYRYWEIRSRAAKSVAEIGKMGFHRMRTQVLEEWAGDQRSHVRAAVGYSLVRLYKDPATQSAVNDLLSDWSDKDQPWANADWAWRMRWTAASVYKHIGLEDYKTAISGLKRLAQYNDTRIADSVIHTLVVLSLQGYLEEVICTLGDWVAEGTGGKGRDEERERICVIAIYSFVFLAGTHVEVSEEETTMDAQSDKIKAKAGNFFELVKKSAVNRGKVWQAVVSLGVRALEHKLVEAFFAMIELWAQPAAKDNRLRDTLCDLIAEVFQLTKPDYRERIFNQLNKWERKTKDEALSNMARAAKYEIKRRVLG